MVEDIFPGYCKKFMETVREVAKSQKNEEENKDALNAAGLLEKLSLGDKEGKEKVRESSHAPKEEPRERSGF